MNLRENFEKLRCARLQEQKERLQAELKNLEKIYNKIVNEGTTSLMTTSKSDGEYHDSGWDEQPQYPGQPQFRSLQDPSAAMASQQAQQYGPQRTKTGRKKIIGKDGQAQSEDTTDTKEPFELAQPHHGFALTPMVATAQKDVLTRYFDNPATAQREIPQEATWQNVNQSISHYSGQQVQNLLRQQRMLG